jgi:hypothetical protein
MWVWPLSVRYLDGYWPIMTEQKYGHFVTRQ